MLRDIPNYFTQKKKKPERLAVAKNDGTCIILLNGAFLNHQKKITTEKVEDSIKRRDTGTRYSAIFLKRTLMRPIFGLLQRCTIKGKARKDDNGLKIFVMKTPH